MRVKRGEVKDPTLPEEEVPVPELGGDVLVRGVGLTERLELQAQLKKLSKGRKTFGHIAPLLAVSVLDADDEPLFTVKEWEAWGAEHREAALMLWDIAWRLSDLGGEVAAKNSKAPTSASSQS